MRNLLSTTAMIAAMALAAPAFAQSGQNIDIEGVQRNAGSISATTAISGVSQVGVPLNGSALAVGNVLQTTATRTSGQGFSDVATNQGAPTQNNLGTVNANVNVSTSTAGAAVLSSTAAGNLINQSGQLITNGGNGPLTQVNSGNVTADLTLQGGNLQFGALKASSLAIGNSLSADASNQVQLGTGFGSAPVTQTNTGAQTANTNFVFGGDSSSLTASATAVGNSFSPNAPQVGVSITQNNSGGGQAANLTALQGTQVASLNSSALGNVVGLSGNFATGGIVQSNSAAQNANTNVNVAVFNGGATTAGATAVGNVLQLDSTQTVSINGSQDNSGFQTANLTTTGGNYTGGATLGSTAVGNLINANVGGFSSQFPQTNSGAIVSNDTVSGGTFGGVTTVSSFAAGNALQVQTSLAGGPGDATIGGAANQLNTGSVTALTSVGGASFSNLTATSTAIGNLSSIKTGN